LLYFLIHALSQSENGELAERTRKWRQLVSAAFLGDSGTCRPHPITELRDDLVRFRCSPPLVERDKHNHGLLHQRAIRLHNQLTGG
jgi:hypothetical protein